MISINTIISILLSYQGRFPLTKFYWAWGMGKLSMVSSVFTLSVQMMTSSNGNIFRVTGHLCEDFTGPGEFPAQRLVTRNFDVLFDLRLNKRLSKQSWGWWFETLPRPFWRPSNDNVSKYLAKQLLHSGY